MHKSKGYEVESNLNFGVSKLNQGNNHDRSDSDTLLFELNWMDEMCQILQLLIKANK